MNSRDITGKTGKIALTSGVYRSGDQYIPLSAGETFPPSSDKGVTWNLVVSL
jgi:hypothetical protein